MQEQSKSPTGNKRPINRQEGAIAGPVSDLRLHLREDWWRHLFGSLYLKTDGDVVCDERLTGEEVDRICDVLQLKDWEDILDLCCGQGRHSLQLARRGYRNVSGLDRSRYLIRQARSRAKSEGLSIRYREGDARNLPYPADGFDAVLILGNSFGYFENQSEDLLVLKQVLRVLKPEGRILLDVADGAFVAANYEPRSWEWIDDQMFVCRERMLDSPTRRLICREVITGVSKGVLADHVYAERLYTQEELSESLEKVEFRGVEVHESRMTESDRNQDLGMMARRLMITATARKSWAPIRRKRKNLVQVAVILGDPGKSDIVKPNHSFDADDIHTVDELKSALGGISERKFIFLDHHDHLLKDVQRLRPGIDYVFNLCDEGYQNDPFMELHVPALLEVFGIPYTGSGPQCLATCYDKSMVRGLAGEMGIPVSAGYLLPSSAEGIEIAFPYPLIVKPNFGDSSFGIFHDSVVEDEEALTNAVSRIRTQFGYDKPILLEEFLPGKDLTIGIIGDPRGTNRVLPITEEDYSALPPDLPRICGYEAKWCPDSPYWKIKTIEAELPRNTEEMIAEWSLLLANRLGVQDYMRFDWRLDGDGQPRLLEVNPNPGWCWDGHLAKASGLAGMSYTEMLQLILISAEERINKNGTLSEPVAEAPQAMTRNVLS